MLRAYSRVWLQGFSDNIIGEVLWHYPVWEIAPYSTPAPQIYHFLILTEKNDMKKDTKQKQSKSKKKCFKGPLPKHLEHINKMAAGIDIGSRSHFVAVPEGSAEVCVREFKSFTSDLIALADWLNECGIETVAMTQAVELYETYQQKIATEELNERAVKRKGKGRSKNAPLFNLKAHLVRITGVDLTAIPGIEATSALKIISEIGLDLTRWKDSKQCSSWLGLCPGNRLSGGKHLGGKSKRTANYAASTLCMAASTLHRSDSALGAFFRRLKSRLGAPKATTAAAHKLGAIIFQMIVNGKEYDEVGQDYYEKQYRDRMIKNLSFRAKTLGFELIKIAC